MPYYSGCLRILYVPNKTKITILNIELKHTVFVGSEKVIKSIESQGCIRVLNRKTMKWQNFAADASFAAVKDPDVETGWVLLCDRDVRLEATQQGYII